MLAAVVIDSPTDSRCAPITRALLIGLVVISTVPQANHVRPQLFSLALFAWLLAVLVRTRHSQTRPPVADPNHDSLGKRTWRLDRRRRDIDACGQRRGALRLFDQRQTDACVAIAVAAVAATIFNPYGWHLWQFLERPLDSPGRTSSNGSQSYRLDFIYVALWGLVVVALVIALWRAARTGRSICRRSRCR